MNQKMKNIITIILLTLIPMLIMLPFAISKNRIELVEVGLIIFGCLELLVLNVRVGKRERHNRRTYNRYKSNPEDEGYSEFRNSQNLLIISGVVNILLSVIWFYIFGV